MDRQLELCIGVGFVQEVTACHWTSICILSKVDPGDAEPRRGY